MDVPMARVKLSSYSRDHSARSLYSLIWFLTGLPLLRCTLIPFSGVRCVLLRLFGAQIGRGVVIKPGVRVKSPRLLRIGDHSWIGEECWIDNLAPVEIGSDVCVSQGAFLCTGNHDWSDSRFRLRCEPIRLESGCWVGARSVVCPGVTIHSHAITTAGSVLTRDVPAWAIYSGNPAVFQRERKIKEFPHSADELFCAEENTG